MVLANRESIHLLDDAWKVLGVYFLLAGKVSGALGSLLDMSSPQREPRWCERTLSEGGCHADGSVALAFSTGRGWFGCRSVALPGEVDDGGGVECRGGHGPRPGWGSAVRGGGRLEREGRGREEPA